MEEKCKMFNRDRYMEEYDVHIELNFTLSRDDDITALDDSYVVTFTHLGSTRIMIIIFVYHLYMNTSHYC